MEKECAICGAFFTASKSNQKYCPECGKHSETKKKRMEHNYKRSLAEHGTGRKKEPREVICKQCGMQFTTWGYGKKFCSKNCEEEYQIEHTTCEECGKRLVDCGLHELVGTPWFCSTECKEHYRWKKAKEAGRISTCPYCGREFINHSGQTFCNRDCYNAAVKEGWKPKKAPKIMICMECGKQFFGKSYYCSKECEEKAEKRCKEAKEAVRAIEEARRKKKEEKEKKYIEENGLCSICRTSYIDCERMQTNFRMSPKGAVFRNSKVVICPKFTDKKK